MKEIQLRNSANVALVSDEDYSLVSRYSWRERRSRHGRTSYAYTTVRRADGTAQKELMHRIILGLAENDKQIVDHADGDGLNNTRTNIRLATYRDNAANVRLRSDTSSGYKGVSIVSSTGRWRSRTGEKGKIYLGQFRTRHEAGYAYNAAARTLYSDFSLLNDIAPDDLPSPERQAEIERQVNRLLVPHMAALATEVVV